MFLRTRFMRSLLMVLGSALLLAGSALAETYEIDKVHSSVAFSIRHLVSRTGGTFNDFSGTIQYDPKDPKKTQVEAVIQVASIDTKNEKRDGHLKSADFFAAEKYPTITFKSTKAERKGDVLMITGDFTMHGTTKKITLSVEVLGLGAHPRNNAPVAGFASELVLKRSDYGIDSWTDMAGVLGDEVKVALTIEAIGKAPVK